MSEKPNEWENRFTQPMSIVPCHPHKHPIASNDTYGCSYNSQKQVLTITRHQQEYREVTIQEFTNALAGN